MRRTAQPALQPAGTRPVTGTDIAQSEHPLGIRQGAQAQAPIGRTLAPGLIAAIAEIGEDGAGHDRHRERPHADAALARRQPRAHGPRGVQAERRPAGEHDRVDAVDQAGGVEQIGFGRARGATGSRHRGDGTARGENHGDARAHAPVFGVADRQSWNIGDEIETTNHGASLHKGAPS